MCYHSLTLQNSFVIPFFFSVPAAVATIVPVQPKPLQQTTTGRMNDDNFIGDEEMAAIAASEEKSATDPLDDFNDDLDQELMDCYQ